MPSRTNPPVHWVREPARIAALRSIVRQRIIDRLEAIGPASIRELAEALDLKPDRLYYHVRALEAHAHVAQIGERGEGRSREALYDLPHRRWHIAYDLRDRRNTAAVRDLTRAMLRQAQRDFEGGCERRDAATAGPERELWSLRLEAALTRTELRELNEHLQAIVALLRKPRRTRTGTLVALTWILAPLGGAR